MLEYKLTNLISDKHLIRKRSIDTIDLDESALVIADLFAEKLELSTNSADWFGISLIDNEDTLKVYIWIEEKRSKTIRPYSILDGIEEKLNTPEKVGFILSDEKFKIKYNNRGSYTISSISNCNDVICERVKSTIKLSPYDDDDDSSGSEVKSSKHIYIKIVMIVVVISLIGICLCKRKMLSCRLNNYSYRLVRDN